LIFDTFVSRQKYQRETKEIAILLFFSALIFPDNNNNFNFHIFIFHNILWGIPERPTYSYKKKKK